MKKFIILIGPDGKESCAYLPENFQAALPLGNYSDDVNLELLLVPLDGIKRVAFGAEEIRSMFSTLLEYVQGKKPFEDFDKVFNEKFGENA